jgi:hypothetical protein
MAIGKKLHPPFARPDSGRRETPPRAVESAPIADELPSIDEFVDDLPMIEEFLAPPPLPPPQVEVTTSYDWAETSLYRPPTPPQPQPARASPVRTVPVPDIDSDGWAAGDWQSYDWRQVSSLGAPAPEAVEAHAAWSSTDWESTSKQLSDLASRPGGLPAEEVARALDEIARRIRSGELSLERFHGTPPEAAIAAVFAALLRTRA